MRIGILALLALCACHNSATRPPFEAPRATVPAAVESCSEIGATKDGKTCAVYDTKKQAFAPTGDGTPADALARRVFLYERWLNRYNAPEHQVAVRRLRTALPATASEEQFGDLANFEDWDDIGDSAGFSDTAVIGALFKYLVTGTDADYASLDAWIRGQLMQWDATGMDGYLARFHYAGVPPGTQLPNDKSMEYRDPADKTGFDIPATALDRMPAYYKDAGVKPTWIGRTSIDAYSGPMNNWPLVYDLVKDPALKARMALHYGCFMKRLRIIKIVNLSKNAELQSDLSRFLTSQVVKLDPDDPDLSKIDEVWGFYLPQWNHESEAVYPRDCPAHLATEALPEDTVDILKPGFEGRLIDIVLRQGETDSAKSIDFAFYPSVRGGDAVMLEAYALGAYHMTGDEEFLRWRDQVLIGKTNAREVSRTIGAFNPPRPCRSYYRTPNVYSAHLMRTLIDNQSHDFSQMLWTQKFARREMAGLRDALFDSMKAVALGTKEPGAVPDLLDFGGAVGTLDSPRRNYPVDLGGAKAPQAEIDLCSQPVKLFGLTVPIDPPNPDVMFLDTVPPVMQRPPDNWIWEKDPFQARRSPGDAGMQQYPGLDLIEPYWIARYAGLLPDTGLVLAWQ